jgi:aspartate oxidase
MTAGQSGGYRSEAIEADVLVLGAGLAGLQAALCARQEGLATVLVCKGDFTATGNTSVASGGFAVSLPQDPDDSPDAHAEDTLRAGQWLNDDVLVSSFCHEAPRAIERLGRQGVRFVSDNGRLRQFAVPGHRARRSVRCVGGGTTNLVGPLTKAVREAGVTLVSDFFAVDLLKDAAGRAAGAFGVSPSRNKVIVIRARAVVLAAGGMGQLYHPHTSTAPDASADGYAIGLRAGCILTGMEFIQFTPTAITFPDSLRGLSPGGAILAQHGVRLLNNKGERFMERYDPVAMEAATRDIVSRSIYREIIEGRASAHNGIFLDIRDVQRDIATAVSARFLERAAAVGLDPFTTPVELAPAAHFSMGGICVGLEGQTSISNLFAAGEVAGGLHGANRLNSNGLTEAAIFGWRAGQQAAVAARECPSGQPQQEADVPFGHQGTELCLDPLLAEIRALIFAAAGMERSANGLLHGLDRLRGVQARLAEVTPDSARQVIAYIGIRNAILSAECLMRSALAREESRGAHYRTDFPAAVEDLYVCESRLDADQVTVRRVPHRLTCLNQE